MSLKLVAPVLLVVAILAGETQAQQNAAANGATVDRLSPSALDALVAGVALYPDQVVEHALAAAFDPAAIQQAVQLTPTQFQQQQSRFSDSLVYLRYQEPALLVQMNQHLSLTASLGSAAQTQLEDVWAAVDRVRAQYQASEQSTDDQQAVYDEQATGTYAGSYGVVSPYYGAGGFAAGLVTAGVVNELNRYRPVVRPNPYYGAPGRTAVGGAYHQGNTNVVAGNRQVENNVVRINTGRPGGPTAASNAWAHTYNSAQRTSTSRAMTQSWGELSAVGQGAGVERGDFRGQGNDAFRGGDRAVTGRPDTGRPTSRPAATGRGTQTSPAGRPNSTIRNGGANPGRFDGTTPSRRSTPTRSFGGGGRGGRGRR